MIPVGALAGACALVLNASAVGAQTAANVAVVINDSSPASVRIGEHYAATRGIPADNVIRITVPPGDAITRASFGTDIEAPLARALNRRDLQDRVLYIVLTKGIPLRITGTVGPQGTTASVDSELTLLYRRMTGRPVPPGGPIDNPYYAGEAAGGVAQPFSHKAHDIYLVTRLDGFAVEDVITLIDRGLEPETAGNLVFDQRADARGALPDRWMAEAADALRARTPVRSVLLERSTKPVTTAEPVLGYFSWGATDPSMRGQPLDLAFARGSIAATLASSDAATFEPAANAFRPIAGDLIKAGASGVGAYAGEPYLQSTFRPQILFSASLDGLPLAEAFYRAQPHLSWQAVVLGDPLVRPFGTAATAPDLDPPADAATGLPAFFSARRLEVLRAGSRAIDPAALPHILASERHQAREETSQAAAALVKAVAAAPDAVALQLQLAVLQEEAGQVTEAVAGYRRVLAVQPRSVVAMNNLAYALATRSGSLDEALTLATQAQALAPEDGTVLDTLGWIQHLRGNSAEAAPLLRRAAERAPGQPDVRLHAAIVLAGTGALDEARGHLEAALKLKPALADRDDVKQLGERLRK
jgi:uncharacterized protein (TIGR03790 family)